MYTYQLYNDSDGKYCATVPSSPSSSSSSLSSPSSSLLNGVVLVERVKDADMVQFTVMTLDSTTTTTAATTNDDDDDASIDRCDVWMIRISYDDIKRQISDVWDYGDDDDDGGGFGGTGGSNDDKYLEHFENATLNNNGISISMTSDSEISIEFSYMDESSSPSLFKRVVPIHRRGCSDVLFNAVESMVRLCQHIKARGREMEVPSEVSKRRLPDDQHHGDDDDGRPKDTKRVKRQKLAVATFKNRGVRI